MSAEFARDHCHTRGYWQTRAQSVSAALRALIVGQHAAIFGVAHSLRKQYSLLMMIEALSNVACCGCVLTSLTYEQVGSAGVCGFSTLTVPNSVTNVLIRCLRWSCIAAASLALMHTYRQPFADR